MVSLPWKEITIIRVYYVQFTMVHIYPVKLTMVNFYDGKLPMVNSFYWPLLVHTKANTEGKVTRLGMHIQSAV